MLIDENSPYPYPIQPWDIKTDNGLLGAFGKFEAECAAVHIVRFCTLRENWTPFTPEDIKRLAPETLRDFIDLGREGEVLEDGGWIVKCADGQYRVTSDFIERCYEMSKMAQ